MAELSTHVGDRGTFSQQQAGEGVPHLMRTAVVQAGGIQQPIERFPDVRFIERRFRASVTTTEQTIAMAMAPINVPLTIRSALPAVSVWRAEVSGSAYLVGTSRFSSSTQF
jgi:hypothetical protein